MMPINAMPHANDEQLEEYSMGTLPEPELAGFEEHLLVCPACQDHLAETDAYVRAMRCASAGLRAQAKSRSWPLRFTLAEPFRPIWAAGLAVAVLALLVGTQWWLRRAASSEPFSVLLESSRGSGVQAPARTPLRLNLDLIELPALTQYRLEIVDAEGNRIWESTAAPQNGRISVIVRTPFSRGMYYVQLYAPPQELLREYGLRIVAANQRE